MVIWESWIYSLLKPQTPFCSFTSVSLHIFYIPPQIHFKPALSNKLSLSGPLSSYQKSNWHTNVCWINAWAPRFRIGHVIVLVNEGNSWIANSNIPRLFQKRFWGMVALIVLFLIRRSGAIFILLQQSYSCSCTQYSIGFAMA